VLHVVQLAEQLVLQAQHGFGALQHNLAGGSQADLRADAVEQRRAQAVFQLCDLFAHGGLADVQGFPGLGKPPRWMTSTKLRSCLNSMGAIPVWNSWQSNNSLWGWKRSL